MKVGEYRPLLKLILLLLIMLIPFFLIIGFTSIFTIEFSQVIFQLFGEAKAAYILSAVIALLLFLHFWNKKTKEPK